MERKYNVKTRRQVKLTHCKHHKPPHYTKNSDLHSPKGNPLLPQLPIMTNQQLPIPRTEMHRPAEAIPKYLAISALT